MADSKAAFNDGGLRQQVIILTLGDATILKDMDTTGQEMITRDCLVYKLEGHECVLITSANNECGGLARLVISE